MVEMFYFPAGVNVSTPAVLLYYHHEMKEVSEQERVFLGQDSTPGICRAVRCTVVARVQTWETRMGCTGGVHEVAVRETR